MIIIDEKQLCNGTLLDIFESMGYETLYRKRTEEEIQQELEELEKYSVDENSQRIKDFAVDVIKNKEIIDYEGMIEKYIPRLQLTDAEVQFILDNRS